MQRRFEQIEKSIDRYMAMMDTADRQDPEIAEARKARLGDKVKTLKERMEKLKTLEAEMLETEDKQLSLTDPDARSMMTSGRGTGMVGYNVQASVPKPQRSGSKAKGRFGKQDFVYLPDEDVYRCPAGEFMNRRFQCYQDGKTFHCYATTACVTCPLQAKCTTGPPWRRIRRWEHEAVLDEAQRRLDFDLEKMAVRRCTAEHPFGTLKSWMGATHFLTRTMERVSAEMSLHVLAYNMKRMIKSWALDHSWRPSGLTERH